MATRITRIELISGVAAGMLGLLTWVIWLFVPLHRVYTSGGPYIGTQVNYTSPVDDVHGLNNFIRDQPIYSLLILAFLVLMGAAAYGVYLHVRRSVPEGRLIVWGVTIVTLLLLSALHMQVPLSLVAGMDAQVQGLGLSGASATLA
jgi:hypothetical protein